MILFVNGSTYYTNKCNHFSLHVFSDKKKSILGGKFSAKIFSFWNKKKGSSIAVSRYVAPPFWERLLCVGVTLPH